MVGVVGLIVGGGVIPAPAVGTAGEGVAVASGAVDGLPIAGVGLAAAGESAGATMVGVAAARLSVSPVGVGTAGAGVTMVRLATSTGLGFSTVVSGVGIAAGGRAEVAMVGLAASAGVGIAAAAGGEDLGITGAIASPDKFAVDEVTMLRGAGITIGHGVGAAMELAGGAGAGVITKVGLAAAAGGGAGITIGHVVGATIGSLGSLELPLGSSPYLGLLRQLQVEVLESPMGMLRVPP